ncbi:MAG: N-acetylmuramoyl-L-alanine amidase [Promicromonosporaceae bacterium]|nr:N-acetylmuramoyl-L-alanine amidase [Promicromonosporaceae bacterium]
MQTIPSPNKYTGRTKPIRLIVIHDMEVAEVSTAAESVARGFANPARMASAHVCVDNDSSVRCVDDGDTAWAAPGANSDGLQLEMAGYASQGAAGWSDAYSQATLERAAQQVAAWCKQYGIQARRLSVPEVQNGATKGICGHIDVSNAFHESTHTDPGLTFPWDAFLARVNTILGGVVVAPGHDSAGVGVPTPPPVDTRPRNADGSLTIAEDGMRGPATIARWQEVMGTPIDGKIDATGSALIKADQAFLNRAVPAAQIHALTGANALAVDGAEGPKTIKVRQFWLFNKLATTVLHRAVSAADFDGVNGPNTNRLHQHALNNATARTSRY